MRTAIYIILCNIYIYIWKAWRSRQLLSILLKLSWNGRGFLFCQISRIWSACLRAETAGHNEGLLHSWKPDCTKLGHAHVHICVFIHTWTKIIHTHKPKYPYTCIYIYIRTRFRSVSICVYIYIYLDVHIYIYKHMEICIYS